MASNPPSNCCFTGFKHEGTATGEMISIGNISTYIARPKGDDTPQKAVLILSDVFGIFTNSQLIADDFAANGYLAVLPDLFAGDKMDISDFEAGRINIPEWLSRNGPDAIDPRVESVLRHLRESLSVKKIACAGYCFGGKYLARFLKQGKIDIGYTAHPSFISDEELAAIENPLSISAAETDQIFTRELRHKSEEILSKTGQHYQLNLFSGVEHGFAIRSDLTKPKNKFGKEQAFLQAIAWFNFELSVYA
ncbi:uncharacterized protein N7458_003689 [Penicillium daleae]|uniref:Dienelactone hydrolase domain-containing protein n=1 Tax=Penicillium daleae TaxID=63821 RepID=A0AAD6CA17_9EURO|nr:uncharacterized protein N7458_003689 [Penicillium daleae]KAJ5456106.1 hypothetical protein N7458_003689 [Penicillium daleae]